MTGERRIRWHGDPAELEQPDAGDVLGYVDPTHRAPDRFELVHFATQVRGRDPHELWLVVTDLPLVDGYGLPDEVAEALVDGSRRYVPAVRRPARRRHR